MPRQCLVFLESPIVAQDLALTMQDLSGCGPIIASSLADAEAQLDALPSSTEIPYAFVHLSPSAYRPSRLREQLRNLGAKVVLTGHAAELESTQTEWPVLFQPFSSLQVADLVAGMASQGVATQT